MKQDEQRYIMDMLEKLIAIDSPVGYTHRIAEYLSELLTEMGYCPQICNNGGVLVEIIPESDQCQMPGKTKRVIAAHIDTLGAIVCGISKTGRLHLSPLGGLNPNNIETENCRVYTRDGQEYEGTVQLKEASIHVNGEYKTTVRSFDTIEVVLDENVNSREEVKALGIRHGDIVAVEPRYRVTSKGYIKSRFLDDKVGAAILLGIARSVANKDVNTISQQEKGESLWLYFSASEEMGRGGAVLGGYDFDEVIALDMGCVGEELEGNEHAVSICAKDSGGPYDYMVVSRLIHTATKYDLKFAVDVFPHYGSDATVALKAGLNARHGLIGAGIYASHGYERGHIDGVDNAYQLLWHYLFD